MADPGRPPRPEPQEDNPEQTVRALAARLEELWRFHGNPEIKRAADTLRTMLAALRIASAERDQLREALRHVRQEMQQIVDEQIEVHCGDRESCLRDGWIGMAVCQLQSWADELSALLAAADAPGEGR